MALQFSITHNTQTDWLKASFSAGVAVLGAIGSALSDGISAGEIITILTVLFVTFGTALGVYGSKDAILTSPPAPVDRTEYGSEAPPVDFQARNAERARVEDELAAAWVAPAATDGEVKDG